MLINFNEVKSGSGFTVAVRFTSAHDKVISDSELGIFFFRQSLYFVLAMLLMHVTLL